MTIKNNLIVIIYIICLLSNHEIFFIEILSVSLRPIYLFLLLGFSILCTEGKTRMKVEDLKHTVLFSNVYFFGIAFLFINIIVGNLSFSTALAPIIFALTQILVFFFTICIIRRIGIVQIFPAISTGLFFYLILSYSIYFYQLISHTGETRVGYLGIFIGHEGMARMTGLDKDPNYFSLSLIILFILSNRFTANKKTYINAVLFAGAIALAGSRAGISISVVVLLIIFNKQLVKVSHKKIFLLLISILVVGFLLSQKYTHAFFQGFERITSIISDFNTGGSSGERFQLFVVSAKATVEHFPTGIGNVLFTMKKYGKDQLPHNDYLTIMIETSIFGFFAYTLFLYVIFQRATTSKIKYLICLVLFVCFFLTAYSYVVILPFFWAVLLSLNNKINEYRY